MVKVKTKIITLLCIAVLALIAVVVPMTKGIAYAANALNEKDGVYRCGFSIGGTSDMGASQIEKYIESSFVVEKSNETYYVTVKWDSSALTNFNVTADGKQVGYENLGTQGGKKAVRYTFGKENIQKTFSVSAYIPAMGRSVSFTLRANIGNATFISELGDISQERPAEFVPVITTSAGSEYEVKQGSVFALPFATAVMGTEDCAVTTSAYYLSNGEKQTVEIAEGRFNVANVGEYHLVYKASSPSYKTNFGNDTFTEYDVKIVSSVGGSTLAKFEDPNGVLPQDTAIMPSRITEGTLYDKAADKMKTIADNFEVFGVSLVSADGTAVAPTGKIELYLQADSAYDRTEAVVYYMDESGNLTKLNASGYGRYVKAETDKTGAFIVCIPGVAFIMPMWGCVLILVACVVVIAAAITVTIVLVKRKKKRIKREAIKNVER